MNYDVQSLNNYFPIAIIDKYSAQNNSDITEIIFTRLKFPKSHDFQTRSCRTLDFYYINQFPAK